MATIGQSCYTRTKTLSYIELVESQQVFFCQNTNFSKQHSSELFKISNTINSTYKLFKQLRQKWYYYITLIMAATSDCHLFGAGLRPGSQAKDVLTEANDGITTAK